MASWSYSVLPGPVLFHYQSQPSLPMSSSSSTPPLPVPYPRGDSSKAKSTQSKFEDTTQETIPSSSSSSGSSQSERSKAWAADYLSKSLRTQQELQRRSDEETKRKREWYERCRRRNSERFSSHPGL